MNRLKILAAAGLATLALFGCGDDANDAVAVPPMTDPLASVPDSAQVDGAGLVAYLEVLADDKREDSNATNIDTVVLTQSDNTEPLALK